jgi:hypothetical protein
MKISRGSRKIFCSGYIFPVPVLNLSQIVFGDQRLQGIVLRTYEYRSDDLNEALLYNERFLRKGDLRNYSLDFSVGTWRVRFQAVM